MATALPKNSVWSAMGYQPPRGPCNYKAGLMSSVCPCLRFMLHPVKAATSFECDSCQHHSGFHALDNPKEDAILAKWNTQNMASKEEQALVTTRKKRKAIGDNP